MQEKKYAESILTVEQGKRVSLTGVESVDGFSDAQIKLTVCGQKVLITGTGLKVQAFSQGSGNFTAVGVVNGVKYGGKALSGLFK